jgi:hypothetical protein
LRLCGEGAVSADLRPKRLRLTFGRKKLSLLCIATIAPANEMLQCGVAPCACL